jgi:hypothetical protein
MVAWALAKACSSSANAISRHTPARSSGVSRFQPVIALRAALNSASGSDLG